MLLSELPRHQEYVTAEALQVQATGSVFYYQKQSKTECHIINNSLTELARAVLGNIDPRSSRSVRTATTSGQYSPVRPSRSVLVSG